MSIIPVLKILEKDKKIDQIIVTTSTISSAIIFEKHKSLIEAAGGKMADFTKLTIFVTRIQNNKKVWKARAEFFEGNFPACSLVEVSKLAEPNIYVEIEGVAHIGKGKY